jgi:hypothetical protein
MQNAAKDQPNQFGNPMRTKSFIARPKFKHRQRIGFEGVIEFVSDFSN